MFSLSDFEYLVDHMDEHEKVESEAKVCTGKLIIKNRRDIQIMISAYEEFQLEMTMAEQSLVIYSVKEDISKGKSVTKCVLGA